MNVELRLIRHAVAVARHGSFARAAADLQLSQSALSRSVQSLESQMGTPIFVRSANGVLPTDVGRLFLERGQALLEVVERFDAQVLRNRTLQRGRLVVGGGPMALESCIADAAARFIADHPMVTVELRSAAAIDLPQPLRALDIDLLVTEHQRFHEDPDVHSEPLEEQPAVMFGRRGHPLAGRLGLTLSDACEYPLIGLGRMPTEALEVLTDAQRRCASPLGRQRALPGVQVASAALGRQVMAGSDALMAMTPAMAQAEVDDGRIVPVLPLRGVASRLGIVHLRSRPLSAAAALFCDQLRTVHAAAAARSRQLLMTWFP